jgi:electron transport complex protein RnfG
MDTLKSVMLRSISGLALFAAATAGLIAVTQVGTADRIKAAEETARSRALLEVVPAALMDTSLLDGAFTVDNASQLGFHESVTAYRIQKDGQWQGMILPWQTGDGYTGPIRGIAAIDRNGTVLGVRVTSHRETPGLGDKIERRKSDWITAFEGLSFATLEPDLWKVRKDGGSIDQMTGATITPRAVIRAVRDTLTFHNTNLSRLYPEPLTGSSTGVQHP